MVGCENVCKLDVRHLQGFKQVFCKRQRLGKMDSENTVAFGSIFDNKVALNDDSESNLLNYSKPEYAASFSNYTDCR